MRAPFHHSLPHHLLTVSKFNLKGQRERTRSFLYEKSTNGAVLAFVDWFFEFSNIFASKNDPPPFRDQLKKLNKIFHGTFSSLFACRSSEHFFCVSSFGIENRKVYPNNSMH